MNSKMCKLVLEHADKASSPLFTFTIRQSLALTNGPSFLTCQGRLFGKYLHEANPITEADGQQEAEGMQGYAGQLFRSLPTWVPRPI